ncbi:MAG: rRNA maturation RNase YbeY [Ignavibacteriaceae bacterium]|jgi:probable rRNA maturation factor
MKVEVELNKKSVAPINKKFLELVLVQTLQKASIFSAKSEISVSVAIVAEEEIKLINKTYRKKNQSTDILSFPEFANRADLPIEEKELFLGELILCYNDIKRYTKENSLNFKEELIKVVAHGGLHLLGFRHGQKMFALQERVVEDLKNKIK